jgi:hypothetical protein
VNTRKEPSADELLSAARRFCCSSDAIASSILVRVLDNALNALEREIETARARDAHNIAQCNLARAERDNARAAVVEACTFIRTVSTKYVLSDVMATVTVDRIRATADGK